MNGMAVVKKNNIKRNARNGGLPQKQIRIRKKDEKKKSRKKVVEKVKFDYRWIGLGVDFNSIFAWRKHLFF